MKSFKITGTIGVVLLVTSMSVTADKGARYGGIEYHMGSHDQAGVESASLTGVALKFGKYISDTVAFEGRLTKGIGDDSVMLLGVDVNVELDHALSLFLKGELPLSSAANLYGLIGFTKGKITTSSPGFSVSENGSGLSYGVGAELELSNDIYLSGEYVFYLSEDTYDYEGFNFGIRKFF